MDNTPAVYTCGGQVYFLGGSSFFSSGFGVGSLNWSCEDTLSSVAVKGPQSTKRAETQ